MTKVKMNFVEVIVGTAIETLIGIAACEADKEEIEEANQFKNPDPSDRYAVNHKPSYNYTLGATELPDEHKMPVRDEFYNTKPL